jgi:hypothetical protein
MDVRFCEGRNHRREAHLRAAGSAQVRRARSSEARLRRIFFSLTKTYMEVGYSEVEPCLSKSLKRRVARDPLEAGGDCSDWRLHCEHGAEPSFAVRNALVSFRSFGQWIGLND